MEQAAGTAGKERQGAQKRRRGIPAAAHVHVLPDGTQVHHSHAHGHTQTKAVLNRMARLIGHLESIRKMIEDGRDCSEVLVQISAVSAALQGVGKLILKDHMEHCIVEAVRENDRAAIEQLNKAIDQFIR